MRTVSVFVVMVTMTTALAETLSGNHKMHKLGKRELLLRSKRRWVLSTIEIVEEDPGPFPKETTQMFNDKTDPDHKNHRFHITGMGVTEEPLGVFSINELTGQVLVHKPIDREKHPFFHINFDILNSVTNQMIDRTLAFDVAVTDINDNAPLFEHTVMTASVPENMTEGYLPVQLIARDMDEDKTVNSAFTISVISQQPNEPKFAVEQVAGTHHGHLTFSRCFDYDKAKNYKVIVQAKDHGIKPLSSTAVVNLHIVDSNTHAPTFKAKEYHGNVSEMETNREVLRISVEDKDTPNTPGWRAKYFFIKGNEDANYKIETDPKTNDGILTVIKGKDYERTTLAALQIGVENEEPLFVCPADSKAAATPPPPNSVNVIIKVIDVNDPPVFDKDTTHVYQREEEEPGKVLYKPKVTDDDSDINNIRFELLEDPADWVTIDKKTGQIKSAKKMDRESPFVDKDIYKILITAIDDGEPPATATGTVLVHLGDVNDNLPKLVNQSIVMCINKGKSIMVPVEDSDAAPFSGPFTFSLGGDDVETLKQRWKLDPASGEAGGLVCLKSLPYGNYSVPLTIQDQQGEVAHETVQVVVCECEGEVCRGKLPILSRIGAPGIGLILAGLLLFLLLLLACFCKCGEKAFKHIPIQEDEGNQTLIKYNEEGGGSACQAEPTLFLTSSNGVAVTDGLKMQMPQIPQIMVEDTNMYKGSGRTLMTSMVGQQHGLGMANDMRSQGGQSMYSMWNTNTMNSYQNNSQNNSSRYLQSFSLLSNQHIADHLDKRLHAISGDHLDYPEHQPHEYAYEGQGSRCQSLDKLSSSNLGDDLEFLNDLGPKFKTLGGICHQTMQKNYTQL